MPWGARPSTSFEKDARAGRVRRAYVYKPDRLTRSGIRDTFELVEELRAAGAELVTVADGFTLDGPAAEVILAVMAWAAKMERLAINERIAAARRRVWRPRAAAGADRGHLLLAAGDAGATGKAIQAIQLLEPVPAPAQGENGERRLAERIEK